jgi:hypothetical protein
LTAAVARVEFPALRSWGGNLMNYKAIEYSLKLVEPGIWKYKFRIGRGIKTGTTKTKLDLVGIHRVQKRIDRELKNAGLYKPSR